MFCGLTWESDSIAFCQGLLCELITDLKSMKRMTDDSDVGVSQHHSFSHHNTSMSKEMPHVATGAATVKAPSIGRPVSVKNIKITIGEESNENMVQYKDTFERFIRERIVHQQGSRSITTADNLTSHIKSGFVEVEVIESGDRHS